MNKEYFNDLIYDKQIKHQMNKNISEKHNISSDQATKSSSFNFKTYHIMIFD